MNLEQKELAEKVMSVFKKSEKDTLYFPNDLENIFLNNTTSKELVINNLVDLKLLEKKGQGFFRITNKGLNFKSFKDLEDKEKKEVRKSFLDLQLKEWQVKTFWWIFGFAVIGTVLSIYNFVDSLTPSEKELKQEQRIQKIESELRKLNTSISNRKKIDSLHNTNVLINNNQ
ncbi:hypothetical protein [Empedobacter falsenii]